MFFTSIVIYFLNYYLTLKCLDKHFKKSDRLMIYIHHHYYYFIF
jgi:hypothetical protein